MRNRCHGADCSHSGGLHCAGDSSAIVVLALALADFDSRVAQVLTDPTFFGDRGARTLFLCDCSSAVDICEFSDFPEAEVLLMPGSKFVVRPQGAQVDIPKPRGGWEAGLDKLKAAE